MFWKSGLLAALFAACLLGADSAAPLADAAEEKDWTALRELVRRGGQVNAPQADGMTALHWAAHHDELEMAKLLLDAGSDVKAATRYGVTPLSLACTNGNGAMVELFLDAGADPNTTTPGGETALMTAARTGKIEAVKALIGRGADVNLAESRRGQSALMWAAAEGHAEVVEELIQAGADFRRPLASGFTPLLFAAREGHIGVVKVLLKAGVDVNELVPPPAAGKKNPRRLRTGMSPLLIAVSNAHYELAALLLDAGADPHVSATGYTPLHAIVSVRKPGVGDNDPPPEGSGSLSAIEFVKKMVAHGANLNAQMTKDIDLGNTRLNKLGATPFFLAAHAADAELMKTLVELGADPTVPNAENSTPLMAAAGLGTRSPGEDAGTEQEVLEALQVLVDLGADLNAVDDNGETVMHAAAYKNLPEVVKFLAAKGAKIDTWYKENKWGWTPLTIAVGYRFGNFKPSPVSESALREVLIAGGVTPPAVVTGKTQQIY